MLKIIYLCVITGSDTVCTRSVSVGGVSCICNANAASCRNLLTSGGSGSYPCGIIKVIGSSSHSIYCAARHLQTLQMLIKVIVHTNA